jgi:hypothetical protein
MRAWFALMLVMLAGCASAGVDRRGGDGGSSPDAGATADASNDDASTSEPCGPGATRFCTTACGTMGIASCVGGFFGACAPPNEDCNGADDDCDGTTDEDLNARMCSSACGGGTEQCTTGHWSGCSASMPGTETCNGMDDDCDSRIDESLTRACTTACGMGTETCMAGTYVGCTARTPAMEACNGMDDDCDSRVDESLTRSCTNACGTAGSERCATGAWVGCTAPTPPAETCNMLDDDCDGTVDEDLQVVVHTTVAMSDVRAYQMACPGIGGGLDTCLTASKRWCAAQGCAIGGAGFLDGTSSTVRVACFGNHASEHMVTFAELASTYAHPEYTEAMAGTRLTYSLVNRWCRDHGFEAGVGPVEHASGAMWIDCLASDQAMYVSLPTSELMSVGGCNPLTSPDDFGCSASSNAACLARGMHGGWGPVEWNTTDSAVVCFR